MFPRPNFFPPENGYGRLQREERGGLRAVDWQFPRSRKEEERGWNPPKFWANGRHHRHVGQPDSLSYSVHWIGRHPKIIRFGGPSDVCCPRGVCWLLDYVIIQSRMVNSWGIINVGKILVMWPCQVIYQFNVPLINCVILSDRDSIGLCFPNDW